MPPYRSNISTGDLELGQDYFGSTVTHVEQSVSTAIDQDNVEIYVVRRQVTLKNGAIMKEKYQREKSLGEIETKTYGLSKDGERKKSRSKSRDKVRSKSKDRVRSNSIDPGKQKKRTPRKNRSMPSGPPRRPKPSSTRTKKKRSKSISHGTNPDEGWANFDDVTASPTKNDVGKLKLEEIWKEKLPEVAIVYPPNDCPDQQDKDKELIIAKGTWKFSEDKPKPEGSDTWVPTYVQLDLDGSVNTKHEEVNVDGEPEKPHGVWGLSPSDDANAGNPSDLWFYPPDEDMDDGFRPIGKWKMLKEQLWPPKSIGQAVDTRKFKEYKVQLNKVGKLKMPAYFSGK